MGKELTFADVSRSLNRLEGFVDDLLLTALSYGEGHIDIEKSMTYFIQEIKWIREGDESINFFGIHDCIDFILNNQSKQLAKRAFSVESKISEIERIVFSCNVELKLLSGFLWETGRIIGEIQELHIEPFVQELPPSDPIPQTGGDKDVIDGTETHNKPMTKDEIIKSLEGVEKFEPVKPINLYSVYHDRLSKAGILRKVCDDVKENIDLFQYCVERADISKLFNTGKKSYARLFMNDIAFSFAEPEKFRKAAAKSFGVKEVGGVGDKYKKDYRLMMKGLFPDDADYRKGKPKK